MGKILIIYAKEIKEVLRDRRTLFFMVVFPLVFLPLLFNLMTSFMQKQERKARAEVLKAAIIHGDRLPALVKAFQEAEGFELVTGFSSATEFEPALLNGDIKLGIEVPEDIDEYLRANLQANLLLYYQNAAVTSKVVQRTRSVINALNDELRAEKFGTLGVTSAAQREGLMEPAKLTLRGIASKREVIGSTIGGFLPYIIVLFCFSGAIFPAVDLGAGEKERCTLETLLLTPVPRAYLVLGKSMVIFTSSLLTGVLSLASMAMWIKFKGGKLSGELGEVISSITVTDLSLIALMLVPTAVIFAAILLSVSIYARTFKEAQSYMVPFNLMIIFPVIIATLPGIELNWTWAMVPITNISLAIKELAKGTIDYTMLGVIFLSTAALATILTAFCVKWFQKESVLFRG